MCACVVYRAVELSLPTCLVWISTSLSLSPLSTAFFHVLDIRCRTVGQFSNHVGLYNSTSALRLLLFESSEILLAEKNGEFLFDWNSRSSDSYEYRLICSVWILERGWAAFFKVLNAPVKNRRRGAWTVKSLHSSDRVLICFSYHFSVTARDISQFTLCLSCCNLYPAVWWGSLIYY